MKRTLPDVAYLNECFIYEPDTGHLIWKVRPAGHFPDAPLRIHRTWLNRFAGQVAGSPQSNGYLQVAVNCRLYKVHRIIWTLMTGKEPVDEIDHVDRNRQNNKWANLCEATHQQNGFNSQGRRRNQQHLRGAYPKYYSDGTIRYQASAQVNGKFEYLGLYNTEGEAHAQWVEATRPERGKFHRAD